MPAYGVIGDAVDGYACIGETITRKCLYKFTKGIIEKFGEQYLRRLMSVDLNRLLHIGEQHGLPGMVGSINCMHWEWKKSPTAWRGMFHIVLKVVTSQDLRIWHAFFSITDSCNDFNVLYCSPVFDDVMNKRAPPVSYIVNGYQYEMDYYLTDGIYLQWAAFIQSVTLSQIAKKRLFAKYQETVRKDVEHAFRVLQARFSIIQNTSLAWNQKTLANIIKACNAQYDRGG